MRERSHKKGEIYQRDIKKWLIRSGFLGFKAKSFGDAYDVTHTSCMIGGKAFDFSLKLRRGGVTRQILYCECKYRDERTGSVSSEFKSFLTNVHDAVRDAETDARDSAVFVFVSNIPPEGWRRFLKDRHQFCISEVDWGLRVPDHSLIARLVPRTHVLVLSDRIVERVS